ncbi:MAG: hypothetical protein WC695_11460 [Candidatus Omnitrophota bacterium]
MSASTDTIDTAMAKRMVEASAIRGASIIGQAGGWAVMLKLGIQEKPLGVQRSTKPRLWRSLDSCVEYLRNELKISKIDLLDSSNFSKVKLAGKSRPDAAARMRRAFQAADHDAWFREQVEQGLKEADDPNAVWFPHEEVVADMQRQRESLIARIGKTK